MKIFLKVNWEWIFKNIKMKKLVRLLLVITVLGVSCQSDNKTLKSKPNPINNKSEKIEELIKSYEENKGFSGSVLVVENSKVIYKGGIGLANKELEVPNDPLTKHRIGSLTKQFTAMLILQLVEKNKIELDATINKYIPDYPRAGGDKITIHHLLTHSSGIPRFSLEKYRDPYTPDELLALWDDSGLDFEPGKQFTYSNPGYFLLGVIIERVTKKTYEQVLHEQILDPLGMKNSGYDRHSTILMNRSSGYVKQGTVYENAGYTDMTVSYAAGAMYSTIEDMFLWDQALYSDKILSSKYRDLLFKSHLFGLGRFYGYGCFNSKYPVGSTKDSINVIEHSGGIQGYSARITRISTNKNLIIILSNVQGTETKPLTYAIMGILYDKPYEFPKKSFADALFSKISENGVKAGVTFFKEHQTSGEYNIKEREMNSLGYDFLESEKLDTAMEIFKMNTTIFPESSNAFDSLGEVYVLKGNKEKAIESYEKSVFLDPNNMNAIKKLKELK
ncbi:serine hydrolase [Maribacter sp. IgM3_T14_3]|uniref:serine hydrolase n=1 Tax=Maribacter sp. IgM3_T14_3 TaxID=3415140 RepID=UPI003C6FDABC